MAAAADRSVPETALRAIADRIPGARYEVVGEAAHLFPLDQPEVAAELLAMIGET